MLTYPPEKRITAHGAYDHDWIKSKKFNEILPETSQAVLNNLRTFNVNL